MLVQTDNELRAQVGLDIEHFELAVDFHNLDETAGCDLDPVVDRVRVEANSLLSGD